jgi:hypothetical protein
MIKNVVSGVAGKLGLPGVVTDNFVEELFSGNESGIDDLVGNVVNALCTKGFDAAAGIGYKNCSKNCPLCLCSCYFKYSKLSDNSASQGAAHSASNDGEDPTG